jgi:TolB-like protein/Tfp pilus assembly protein PilF
MSLFDELKRRNVFRMAGLYFVAAWLILQVADLLLDAFEVPSWAMRLLVVSLALGLPLALVFSWIFEWTPDGVKRDEQASSGAIKSAARQRMNMAIAVLIVLAIGVFGVGRLVPETTVTGPEENVAPEVVPERTIAVLPFVNMSDDPDNEYFSDGLSEELLNVLATIPELRVIARTSSFAFKGKDADIRSIGEQLNVANVLEGSVRKAGNQVRITAQLIATGSGYHLWSQSYDRTLDDVFAIQGEIAGEVADALRVSILGTPPQVRQTDPEAFAAYLHGLYFYQQRSREGYEKAVEYVLQCLSIDPDYAPALTLLSATYANQALIGYQPFAVTHEKALVVIGHALRVDPDFALANSARAWLAATYENDFAAAALFYRRALELSPGNAIILGNAAVLLRTLGRLEEAIAMTESSLALNPVSSTTYTNLSDQLFRVGRHTDAIEAARKAIELTAGNNSAIGNLAFGYLLVEQPEAAIRAIEQSTSEFLTSAIRTMAYHSMGEEEQAQEQLNHFIEQYSDTQAFYIGVIYAWRNEIDLAFDWLHKAFDERQQMRGINTDPFLSILHDDPRWEALLARIGMSAAQLSAIEF